jgi:integrase
MDYCFSETLLQIFCKFLERQMARKKPSTTGIENKQFRLAIKPGSDPSEEKLSKGRFFGYRRATKDGNGTWYARMRDAETGRRAMNELGTADDYSDANGIDILTYADAQRMAMEWFELELRQMRSEESGEVVGAKGKFTVSDAMEAYFKDAEQRGMKGIKAAMQSSNSRIIPALGQIEVGKLTQAKLEKWLYELSISPKTIRGKVMEAPKTPEEIRSRRETSKRILNILKPALNLAYKKGLTRANPLIWREVKPFRNTTSARIRFLEPDEAKRLVNSAQGDFRDFVLAGLFTGARREELANLRVRDYSKHGEAPTIFISESKAGPARHIYLVTDEMVTFFDGMVAKRQNPDDLIFTHWIVDRQLQARDAETKRFKASSENRIEVPWGKGHQRRRMIAACKQAGIEYLTFHELRHTMASMLINRGCPLLLVARQLGHSDTRMVEKHYGHLVPSHAIAGLRAAMPTLGVVEPPKIKRLKIN